MDNTSVTFSKSPKLVPETMRRPSEISKVKVTAWKPGKTSKEAIS